MPATVAISGGKRTKLTYGKSNREFGRKLRLLPKSFLAKIGKAKKKPTTTRGQDNGQSTVDQSGRE